MKRKILALALAASLLCLTACSGQTSTQEGNGTAAPVASSADPVTEDTTPSATEGATGADQFVNAAGTNKEKLHIEIEQKEISLEELKANEYKVPVLVNITQNPGVKYYEWGAYLDSSSPCTMTTNNMSTDYKTFSSVSDDGRTLWAAWSGGAEEWDYAGSMLEITLTVPMDAQPGASYPIHYLTWSLGDTPHVWSGSAGDWSKDNAVGWTDGGVTITE